MTYYRQSSSCSVMLFDTFTISIDFMLSRPTKSALKPKPEILFESKSISLILGCPTLIAFSNIGQLADSNPHDAAFKTFRVGVYSKNSFRYLNPSSPRTLIEIFIAAIFNSCVAFKIFSIPRPISER